MPTEKIIPVVLCGGSGTRLWPVSRKSFPKQFVPLIDGKSLLELTLRRLSGLAEEVICVASEEHRFLVAEVQEAAQVSGPLILESQGKNTAAAMALAALHAQKHGQGSGLLLFCPADHHIPDTSAFVQTVRQGMPAAQAGAIVTFGVVPSFPSTAYGYIEKGANTQDGSFTVNRFIEKPDENNATTLLLSGKVLWNAGIFLVQADVLLAALEQCAQDILGVCVQAMQGVAQEKTGHGHCFIRPKATVFNTCRAESIDYAVLEKHPHVVVVPFNGTWSDVGSWNAMYDSVDMGMRFKVKRIGVKPSAALSLQKHHHRAEHWIVVQGTAEVTCGKEIFTLTENESTFIPIGEVHRLRNPGQTELEMIEVQSGSYLGEDDIERLEDAYGRVKVA